MLHLVLHLERRHLRIHHRHPPDEDRQIRLDDLRLDDLRLDDLVRLGHQIRLDDLVRLDVVRQIHLDDLRLDDLVRRDELPLVAARQLPRHLGEVRRRRMKMDCYQRAVDAVLM